MTEGGATERVGVTAARSESGRWWSSGSGCTAWAADVETPATTGAARLDVGHLAAAGALLVAGGTHCGSGTPCRHVAVTGPAMPAIWF